MRQPELAQCTDEGRQAELDPGVLLSTVLALGDRVVGVDRDIPGEEVTLADSLYS